MFFRMSENYVKLFLSVAPSLKDTIFEVSLRYLRVCFSSAASQGLVGRGYSRTYARALGAHSSSEAVAPLT